MLKAKLKKCMVEVDKATPSHQNFHTQWVNIRTENAAVWLTVQQRECRRNVCVACRMPTQKSQEQEHVERSQWESPGRPQHLRAASPYPGRWWGRTGSCNCRAELCGGLGKYRARLQPALSHGCGYERAAPKSVLECNRGTESARHARTGWGGKERTNANI